MPRYTSFVFIVQFTSSIPKLCCCNTCCFCYTGNLVCRDDEVGDEVGQRDDDNDGLIQSSHHFYDYATVNRLH